MAAAGHGLDRHTPPSIWLFIELMSVVMMAADTNIVNNDKNTRPTLVPIRPGRSIDILLVVWLSGWLSGN